MAPSALPGNESAPSPRAAVASGGVGPIAPAGLPQIVERAETRGSRSRLPAMCRRDRGRAQSRARPARCRSLAPAACHHPAGFLASVLISARPVIDPSRRASAAGERSSGSANSTSIAIAAGRPLATASTSRAIVSRGHGQVPNASMDARSMSTTITFRSDAYGPTQPLIASELEIEGAVAQCLAHGLRKKDGCCQKNGQRHEYPPRPVGAAAMLDVFYPSRYCRAVTPTNLLADNSEMPTWFPSSPFSNLEAEWPGNIQLTLASAARMRSGAHRLTGVGGVPGETMSVPSPSRRITC